MLRLILLVSVYLAMANDVYTEASVYNCKVDPPYTVEQRREILTLYPIDRWIYTTFGIEFDHRSPFLHGHLPCYYVAVHSQQVAIWNAW